MNKIFDLIIVSFLIFGLSGCYYDNEEELYPQPVACDTINVTYSATIAPILSDNCNSCHGGLFPNANVKTDNYDDLKIIADDGRLWGVVNHEGGFPPMPKDLPQLNACDLRKIRIWLDNGALND